MLGMRFSKWLLGAVVVTAAMAGEASTKSVVGVWQPGLQHGKLSAKEAATVRDVKARLAKGSMKLHKDKTFGCVLMGRVMFGTYTFDGKNLTLTVKEMVGKTAKQTAALPAQDRIAKMVLKNGKFYSLPLTGSKPQVVWKKTG